MLYHRILEKEPQEMWTLRPRHSLWTMYLSTILVRLCVLLVIVALFACGFEVYLHLRSFILNIRSTRDTLCDIFTVHAMSSKIPVRCVLRLVMQDARSYWGNSTSLRSCQVHSTFCWIDYLHKIEFLSIMNSSRAEVRDCLPIVYPSWHMQQRARGSYRGKNENHICELRSEEELYEGRSSQLYMQLLQLRKDSLKKKIRLVRDSNSWPVRYRFSALPMIHCKSQLGAGLWISLDVYNKKKKFTCLWLKSYNKHVWRLFWLFIRQEPIHYCRPSQCMNWYRMTVGVGAARVHKKWRGSFLLLIHFFGCRFYIKTACVHTYNR